MLFHFKAAQIHETNHKFKREYIPEESDQLVFNSDLARQVNGILFLYEDSFEYNLLPLGLKTAIEILKAKNNKLRELNDTPSSTSYPELQKAGDDLYFALLDVLISLREPATLTELGDRVSPGRIDDIIRSGGDFIRLALRTGALQGIHQEHPTEPLAVAIANKVTGYCDADFLRDSGNGNQEKYHRIADAVVEIIVDDKTPTMLLALKSDSKYYLEHCRTDEKLRDTGKRPYITLMRAANLGKSKPDQLEAPKKKDANARENKSVDDYPVSGSSAKEFITSIQGFTQSVPGVSGLEGGRLSDGLETVIEAYLLAGDLGQPADVNEENSKENSNRLAEQERLEDALAGFAKKVLFMADNQQLLNIGNKDIKKYTRLLGAIGNSITIQVNELVARRRHRDGLERAFDSEKLAVQHALGQSSQSIYGDILAEFAGEAKRATADAEAANKACQEADKRADDLKGALAAANSDVATAEQEVEVANKALEAVKSFADSQKEEEKKQYNAAKAAQDNANSVLAKKNEARDACATNYANAVKQQGQLKEDAAKKLSSSKNLTAANDAVQKAKLDAKTVDFTSVHAALKVALKDLQGKAAESDKAAYALALSELEGINAPPSADLIPAEKVNDSKEVFDQLIATLEAEHVVTVSEFGKDSEAARSLEGAIKLAHDYRANQVFIRPPSFYLRSSYPVTSLQNDPALGWQNRLMRHAVKSVPLLGECLVNGSKREDLRIQSEIDKQFWQNINSVRVAGTGNQNYVLTQDDIGNWYTKSYSSNPDEIIKAAQSSALFALGGSMEVNLYDKLRNPNNPTLYKSDIAMGTGSSSFDRRVNNFISQTAADKDTLIAEMEKSGGLRSRIESRWATVLQGEKVADYKLAFFKKDLMAQMDGAYDTILKPALEQLKKGTNREETGDALYKAISKSTDPLTQAAARVALEANKKNHADPQLGLRLTAALHAMVRFQQDLQARVNMLDPAKKIVTDMTGDGKEEEAIKTAQAEVSALHKAIIADLNSVLQGDILGLIQQRKSVVDAFIGQMDELNTDLNPKTAAAGS